MRTRLQIAGLVALMALGCLGLWIGVPLAWLWLTRGMESEGAQFVTVIVGSLVTMLIVGRQLYRLEAVYARVAHPDAGPPAHPSWLRSVSDTRPRRRLTLLEVFLVVSAVVALAALVTWWVALADSPNPSGPLQPL